ncbi:MAG: DNA-directed RNA polymerase subunit delta [Sporolactobacillus sp.]
MTEHVVEQSKIDQLYDILLGSNKEPKTFYEMVDLVFEKGEIEADNGETLARLYTTLSLDGRFLSVGHNLWALRNWYALEQREDDVAKTLGDSTHSKNKISEDGFDDYDDIDEEELDDVDSDDDSDLDEDEDTEDGPAYDDHISKIRQNVDLDEDED